MQKNFRCLLLFVVYGPFSSSAISNVTAFSSYGIIFPPVDPSLVPNLDPNNAITLTLCELWENDSIPVTPGIEVALQRMRPHFALRNIQFRVLRRLIPLGCGDDSVLAVAPTLVDMHMNQSKTGCNLVIGPSCTETMYNVRGLLMSWDVPVVTSGASGIKFDDKKRTKVLTRFGYTQEDVSQFLIRILDHYTWNTVYMVWHRGCCFLYIMTLRIEHFTLDKFLCQCGWVSSFLPWKNIKGCLHSSFSIDFKRSNLWRRKIELLITHDPLIEIIMTSEWPFIRKSRNTRKTSPCHHPM